MDPKDYNTLVYLSGGGNEGGGHGKNGYICVLAPNPKLINAHLKMNKWALAVSRSEMRHFSARSRRSRDCAETYIWYVAQGIPLIDADLPAVWQAGIAKKGHFWMETN